MFVQFARMKLLARSLFNTLVVISSLFLLAGTVEWIHSYWNRQILEIRVVGRWISFDFNYGKVEIESGLGSDGLNGWYEYTACKPGGGDWDLDQWNWHFGTRRIGIAGDTDGSFLSVWPFWLFLPFSFVLPAIWYWRFRQRRLRRDLSLCPKCGYDLRATTDRCPECGILALKK